MPRFDDVPEQLPPIWRDFLQYVAGLFDAGGYVGVSRSGGSLSLFLTVRGLRAPRGRKLVESFGGLATGGTWRISGDRAVRFAAAILPFVHDSREELDRWLDLRRRLIARDQRGQRDLDNRRVGISEVEREAREQMLGALAEARTRARTYEDLASAEATSAANSATE